LIVTRIPDWNLPGSVGSRRQEDLMNAAEMQTRIGTGLDLTTKAQRRPFHVLADREGVRFLPASGKPRPTIRWRYPARLGVVDLYAEWLSASRPDETGWFNEQMRHGDGVGTR
jgi:hypothetical protein